MNRTIAEDMGTIGREKYIKCMTWNHVVERVINILEK
jgi:hypothetical protein